MMKHQVCHDDGRVILQLYSDDTHPTIRPVDLFDRCARQNPRPTALIGALLNLRYETPGGNNPAWGPVFVVSEDELPRPATCLMCGAYPDRVP